MLSTVSVPVFGQNNEVKLMKNSACDDRYGGLGGSTRWLSSSALHYGLPADSFKIIGGDHPPGNRAKRAQEMGGEVGPPTIGAIGRAI